MHQTRCHSALPKAAGSRLAVEYGCIGVVVDAKPDAMTFDERLGFIKVEARAGELGERPAPTPMFLELAAIADSG
jgi:hypothetical protein